ncbi:hypothetical protein DFA_08162 [Cavenderia fasciculata]|uniref:Uncharacterized protein n=1 Tax=Cavenderia fasciculata TaxID=261658 RepID=F4Q5B9_CACFS|nr:uncharacterized protein DFA_08162 [Cavenderia fasciculata]EGG17178.1 hypothetical protein DFA_08162 [Cavenderia fasciculata]|eukprot:XP_004355662.1 hypothetical protein DFA_08162 [Cavenderia fasciculata]
MFTINPTMIASENTSHFYHQQQHQNSNNNNIDVRVLDTTTIPANSKLLYNTNHPDINSAYTSTILSPVLSPIHLTPLPPITTTTTTTTIPTMSKKRPIDSLDDGYSEDIKQEEELMPSADGFTTNDDLMSLMTFLEIGGNNGG